MGIRLLNYVKFTFCFSILVLFIGALTFWYNINQKPEKMKQIVSAYLMVKNEIKTVEACLNSIDGIFDRIVIIHSNEKDDGSIELMNKWCDMRDYCEIHEYLYYKA